MKKIIISALLIGSFAFGMEMKDGIAEYDKGNYAKAYKIFYALAKNGDPKAQYNIALMSLSGKGTNVSHKEAISWYTKAADQNHAPSQYSLGYMYQKQAKTKPLLINQAKYWYTQAMTNGVKEAYTNMAFLYYTGYGKDIPKDIPKAITLLSKAASMGDANAQLNLAIIYGWKNDVPNDKQKTYKYLKQALSCGKSEASAYLDVLCKESVWACKE
ncbi:MAG: tetratricopeptide repeat protein [Sulfurovaceae bacterium]|nr:tetratricopeptide repeat protein [Sulfurovaceae bacterium]